MQSYVFAVAAPCLFGFQSLLGHGLEVLGDPVPPPASAVSIVLDDAAKESFALPVFDVIPSHTDQPRKHLFLDLFGLTESDRARVPDNYRHEPGAEYYFNESSRAYLMIVPNRGYWTGRAPARLAAHGQIPDGVPADEDVRKQGMEILQKLSYEPSRFAHDPNGSLTARMTASSRIHFDRAKNGPVTEIFERGIWFWRSHEGTKTLGLGGGGGVHVSYGNKGAVSEIEIVMRQLKVRQTVQFDSTVAIESALRQGRAVSDTVSRPSAVSKIRVIGVTPFLLELSGSDPQQVVWPVIEAKCTADTADGEQPFRIFIDPRHMQKESSDNKKKGAQP